MARSHATLEKIEKSMWAGPTREKKNREEHVGGAHPKKRKKAALHLVPKLSTGTKVPN